MSNQSYSSRGQGEQRLLEGLLHGLQDVAAGLFLFAVLFLLDDLLELLLDGLQGRDELIVGRVLDDAVARSGGELQKGRLDHALQVARGPGLVVKAVDLA